MELSKTEKTRLAWQIIMLALILSAAVLVIFLPPYGWMEATPAAPGAHSASNSADASDMHRKDGLSPGQMRSYLHSKQQHSKNHDPFLTDQEEQWKQFLSDLRHRPPQLSGIIRIGDEPAVLINGTAYQRGEDVRGYTIVGIHDEHVVFAQDGKTYTAFLTHE
jgi:hypothetical protein